MAPTNGTFVLPNVPLHGGSNELVVTVTDAGTNRWTTNRWVRKDAAEYFLYDGNGNLTNWVSGGTNWVYEWDWADRLVRARSNGMVMLENWYDAAGRRVAKRERVGTGLHIRQYVWDGWESVALLLGTSGAMLESWTRGAGLAGDIGTLVAVTHHGGSWTNGTYYTHHDHRGDIILTRSGTSTVGRYDYSAFGTLKSQVGPDVCRFKFSSKERDPATGWSYYGYRYYAPAWQRWVSADPIGEAGGFGLYLFVFNRPGSSVDAFGLIGILIKPVLAVKGLCAAIIGYMQLLAEQKQAAPRWRYAHCMASCHIARSCGPGTAVGAGMLKELYDLGSCIRQAVMTGTWNSGACASAFQPIDFVDNFYGILGGMMPGAPFCGPFRTCAAHCAAHQSAPEGASGPFYQ